MKNWIINISKSKKNSMNSKLFLHRDSQFWRRIYQKFKKRRMKRDKNVFWIWKKKWKDLRTLSESIRILLRKNKEKEKKQIKKFSRRLKIDFNYFRVNWNNTKKLKSRIWKTSATTWKVMFPNYNNKWIKYLKTEKTKKKKLRKIWVMLLRICILNWRNTKKQKKKRKSLSSIFFDKQLKKLKKKSRKKKKIDRRWKKPFWACWKTLAIKFLNYKLIDFILKAVKIRNNLYSFFQYFDIVN